jgi:two-component system, response regulator PdtaR
LASSEPKKRILVVEDEALVAWLLRDILESRGYEVVGVASTQLAAEDLCRSRQPEVAVVDVKLKQGDGIAAAREMARNGVDVLFLTAHGARLVAESGLGPTGVVEKPFRAECIGPAVEAVSHLSETGEVPNWAPPDVTLIARR